MECEIYQVKEWSEIGRYMTLCALTGMGLAAGAFISYFSTRDEIRDYQETISVLVIPSGD